jgi:ribose 5-phosphate isomerase A
MAHTVTDPAYALKHAAARAAVQHVAPGMIVGLGSGSTAALVVEEIGRRLATGELRDIIGIPTSNATHHHALACGIPLDTLDRHLRVDLTIDGADEIDPQGRVIKGGGGALLREKIVAAHSARWIIVADPSKLVDRLGTRYPVPVEVVRFGWRGHLEALRELGAEPTLRLRDGEEPFVTDEGHYIIDARFPGGLADPAAVATRIRRRPGVVETGLFLDYHPELVIGRASAD